MKGELSIREAPYFLVSLYKAKALRCTIVAHICTDLIKIIQTAIAGLSNNLSVAELSTQISLQLLGCIERQHDDDLKHIAGDNVPLILNFTVS